MSELVSAPDDGTEKFDKWMAAAGLDGAMFMPWDTELFGALGEELPPSVRGRQPKHTFSLDSIKTIGPWTEVPDEDCASGKCSADGKEPKESREAGKDWSNWGLITEDGDDVSTEEVTISRTPPAIDIEETLAALPPLLREDFEAKLKQPIPSLPSDKAIALEKRRRLDAIKNDLGKKFVSRAPFTDVSEVAVPFEILTTRMKDNGIGGEDYEKVAAIRQQIATEIKTKNDAETAKRISTGAPHPEKLRTFSEPLDDPRVPEGLTTGQLVEWDANLEIIEAGLVAGKPLGDIMDELRLINQQRAMKEPLSLTQIAHALTAVIQMVRGGEIIAIEIIPKKGRESWFAAVQSLSQERLLSLDERDALWSTPESAARELADLLEKAMVSKSEGVEQLTEMQKQQLLHRIVRAPKVKDNVTCATPGYKCTDRPRVGCNGLCGPCAVTGVLASDEEGVPAPRNLEEEMELQELLTIYDIRGTLTKSEYKSVVQLLEHGRNVNGEHDCSWHVKEDEAGASSQTWKSCEEKALKGSRDDLVHVTWRVIKDGLLDRLLPDDFADTDLKVA